MFVYLSIDRVRLGGKHVVIETVSESRSSDTDTDGRTRRIVLGTCHHDCPDSCGWQVTVDNGTAVTLRGNPAHPYSRGELCPKVNRFLDRVYDPDRIVTPLILDGPKGSGRYRKSTWDHALELVARRLHEIIDEWGPSAIVPWGDAGNQSVLSVAGLNERFLNKLGASRQSDYICGGTSYAAVETTLGTAETADPLDIGHSRFIVLWGTNTRLTNRHLWPTIDSARRAGAKVVVIDPVRTVTAEAADWFISIRPGTDVAFMLAVMHVLIRDDLVDHDYIQRFTSGFDELSDHVSALTPERAEDICGVDAGSIERFAHEYASLGPAMIRTLIGAEHRQQGSQFFRTLSLLPALIGAWRHRGGGISCSTTAHAYRFVDLDALSASHLADGIERRPISMTQLGRALVDTELDPPVKALFVFNGNPLVALPEAGIVRRGLERTDLFTVVSEQFMTDTARYADVIFPACTQIEQDDVVAAWGHLHIGWNHKAIEPIGDSVPNTELWRRLSRAMGFTDPELFATDEELWQQCLVGIDLETLQRDGVVPMPVDRESLPFADGYPTADGRLAFASGIWAELGHGRLPSFLEPTEGAGSRYPLSLMSPKTHQRFLNTSYSQSRAHTEPEGGPYCEMHPIDAECRGIADGDSVEVFNDRGRLRTSARVSMSSRCRPGVVIVPFGWSSGHHIDGFTVNELTSDANADFGGGVAFYDTDVDVVRIT